MKGQKIDLTSPASCSVGGANDSGKDSPASRPFLGIHFACCEVYGRVYLNRAKTLYFGNCPHCARQVRFRVGPGGTEARFFTVQ